MDGFAFDALARSLTTAGSRRRALTGLFLGSLGLLGARTEDATAKNCKKIKNKKKRKKCLARACVPSCADKTCGPDGCGGACGTCTGGTCQGGICTCPSGATDCAGVCVNTSTDPRHCGGCGRRCTVNETCAGGQCRCGSSVGCGDRGTCCLAGGGGCRCGSAPNFTDPVTCQTVASCPTGSNPCTGPLGGCGPGQQTRACCPAGTTCTAQGTCLQ